MIETRTDRPSDVRVDSSSERGSITTLRPTSTPRTVGRVIITALFAYCAFNAAQEAWSEARDIVMRAPEPLPGILLFQTAVMITSAVGAIGIWRRRSWAPRAVMLWGVIGALFVALLQPMLALPHDALPGLLAGSALLLAMAFSVVAFLRRDVRFISASAAPVHDRKERM
ncbi:MAG: hypothetical protein H7099_03540 [Gemmatimonadaceae bacterium]|nr:hypothetical protein [Gemmatimonadaceae bacterium]